MTILIIAEHDNRIFKPINFHIFTAAQQLGNEIDLLIIGDHCQTVVENAKVLPFRKIWIADAPEYQHQLAENTAPLIKAVGANYQAILMGATTYGKNLLPRVAALLDVAMVGDVIKILSPDTFMRPIYAGNAIATVKSEDPIKLLTIRGTAFSKTSVTENKHEIVVEKISTLFPNTISQFKTQELTVSSRPELTNARVIVSGGRGLKSADNFKLLESLADCLGAAVGASRAAVDAGFAPNDYQVGQTGKVVAPDLYIAIGISGAIQHLAGMKDSKYIVAINSDSDAPIFEIADYGLVGDLFKILPELIAALDKQKQG